MNTKLELMCQDASNYKSYLKVISEGANMQSQVQIIADNLEEGSFVVAKQIRLPSPRDGMIAEYGLDEENDHAWTTLTDFEGGVVPDVESLITTDKATHSSPSIADLVEMIDGIEWNDEPESKRLG